MAYVYIYYFFTFSYNIGAVCEAWFDVPDVNNFDLEDEAGIKTSQMVLSKVIEDEINTGIDASRIILAGFSQGGAISIYTALTIPQKLGGLLALSTFTPLRNQLTASAPVPNPDLPCLQGHHDQDNVVDYTTFGQPTNVLLNQLLTNCPLNTYSGEVHALEPPDQYFEDIKNFIAARIPA